MPNMHLTGGIADGQDRYRATRASLQICHFSMWYIFLAPVGRGKNLDNASNLYPGCTKLLVQTR
jgi:hypothetical protein